MARAFAAMIVLALAFAGLWLYEGGTLVEAANGMLIIAALAAVALCMAFVAMEAIRCVTGAAADDEANDVR